MLKQQKTDKILVLSRKNIRVTLSGEVEDG